jgi:hypothetical protein
VCCRMSPRLRGTGRAAADRRVGVVDVHTGFRRAKDVRRR